MHISFSPQRDDRTLNVERQGDILTINGQGFDFSGLPNGATIPEGVVPTDWIVGSVSRQGGQLQMTLRLPHGPNPSHAVAFPADLLDPPDGSLGLPHDLDLNSDGVDDVES